MGATFGGFLASQYMSHNRVQINSEIAKDLSEKFEIDDIEMAYLPFEIFASEQLADLKTLLILLTGGLLVGFGTRYAGGCTSGRTISGLSNLQVPSLIAVIGFFIGGLVMVNFIFPVIF